MATIEFLSKRLDGANAKLTKLEKKMERILKAQSSNWEVNPYYYNESDIKWTQRDIEDCKSSIEKYTNELNIAIEKSNSRDIKIILDFLENWKNRMFNYYSSMIEDYYNELADIRHISELYSLCSYGSDEYKNLTELLETRRKELHDKVNGYTRKEAYTWLGRNYTKNVKYADGEYEPAKEYIHKSNNVDSAIKLIKKDLEEEANRKYDFIIERTNAIVGQITDASALKIDARGDINGYIYGTRGTASVKTIGAGGYNIQCFHFRTLIHKVNG